MKTIKNILGVVMALVALCTLNSCGEDEAEYTPAETLNSAQVFFPTTNPSKIDLNGAESSFVVSIARVKTDDAVTVPLTLTGGDGNYNAPASVSFAQGAETAEIVIEYDAEAIGPNVYSDLILSIADESLTTPYGMAQYAVTVGIPETWTVRYLGDYTYNLYFTGDDIGLKLSQSDLYADRWKISDWGGGVDFCFTWDQETNKIKIDTQSLGYNDSSYGPVSVKDAGESYYADGVFHFFINYFVSAGSFGSAEEIYTISGNVKP